MTDKNIAYDPNESLSGLRGSLRYNYRGNREDWMLTRDAVHGELLKAIRAIDVMKGVAVAALKHSPPRTQAESLQRQRELEKQKERSEQIAEALSKRRITNTNTTRSGSQFLYQNESSPSPNRLSNNVNSSSYSNPRYYKQDNGERNSFPTAHHQQQQRASSSSVSRNNSSNNRKPPIPLPVSVSNPRISISPPQQQEHHQRPKLRASSSSISRKSPSPAGVTTTTTSNYSKNHEIHLQHISTARTTSTDALMDVDPQLAFEAIAVSKGQLGEALTVLRGDPIDFNDDTDQSGDPPMKVIDRSPARAFYRHNDPDSPNSKAEQAENERSALMSVHSSFRKEK